LGQEALQLAQALGDRAAEAGALWGVAVARLYSAGDINQVTADAQQALSLARELGLQELLGRILINFCWPLVAQKQLTQALAALREAQTIWRELNNLPRLAEASRFVLLLFRVTGDHRGALAEAPEVSALGASIGSSQDEMEPFLSLVYAHMRQGRFAIALNYLEIFGSYVETVGTLNDRHGLLWVSVQFYLTVGALEKAERWADMLMAEQEAIMPNFTSLYLTSAARTKIARGKLEEGRALLDDLLAQLPQDAVWSYNIIPIMLGYGELHLALGQPEALFAGLAERARPYREAGFGFELADEYWLQGQAFLAQGQLEEAREALLLARETAAAQEERAILWKILAAQSELERACGDEAAAARLAGEARALVDDIVDHAGAIRDAFLAQPGVAQLGVGA
jgi:tetratricopeptide (TPR) repeat protein